MHKRIALWLTVDGKGQRPWWSHWPHLFRVYTPDFRFTFGFLLCRDTVISYIFYLRSLLDWTLKEILSLFLVGAAVRTSFCHQSNLASHIGLVQYLPSKQSPPFAFVTSSTSGSGETTAGIGIHRAEEELQPCPWLHTCTMYIRTNTCRSQLPWRHGLHQVHVEVQNSLIGYSWIHL